ncbi:hypothetical protein ISF_00215 [Cordyceps fumosorosea ARSEF 2679]|uniref:Uncharacterized protein n=1 Tax=Cordyceps fumosorosea (strain ARSEF 2679) TaxID=1081104 RepID=A0A162LNI9_CORFA|nr:hypothetical protein ISF_00215 [Cordyceps fumosorosea ARSEF 2679]OAA73314.1 hypothetical protein ISF_00215 [Cordyceps fumosorosea ARSEF 2679]
MADSGMNVLYTVGGYAALAALGYTVYHYSTGSDVKRRAAAAKAKASQPEVRKEDRKKKQRMEAFAQETQSASKAAQAALPEVKEPEATTTTIRDTMDDSAANREFAKQLSKAQEGTKFAARSDAKQREKSVKQSKAGQIDATKATKTEAPVPAPTALVQPEAPADVEELVEEATSAAPAEAGRVDDMLEPKAPAPTVLRISESSKPNEQKKKESKPVEKGETKKQRQNRKKAEAAKAAREEAETERKALEEKQRRQARVAEGRAAKDGSQFTNGAATAWKQGAPNGAPKTNGELHAPLDTFDTTLAPAQQTNGAVNAALAVVEEPVKQEEEEWSTVKTKSSKKKAAAASNSGDEEPAAAPAAAPQAKPVTKQVAPKTNGNSANTKKAFGGSFSALTNDDAEEEEEEEWDV